MTKSTILSAPPFCVRVYTNELEHMHLSFSYTQTHTIYQKTPVLAEVERSYSTANCCRIQTQASTHCLFYRTSIFIKLIPVESFARIISNHRGKGSFMLSKLINFENHQLKGILLSQTRKRQAVSGNVWNHTHLSVMCEDHAHTWLIHAKMWGVSLGSKDNCEPHERD